MISTTAAMLLHPLWCYFLISEHQGNLEIVGAGIANCITFGLSFGINLAYTSCLPDIKKAVFWPDIRTF